MKISNTKVFLILLFCLPQLVLAKGEKPTKNLAVSSDSLTIDTKNDTLEGDGGIKIQSQGMKLQANGFEKDPETGVLRAKGDVLAEMDSGGLNIRIDSKKTLLTLGTSKLRYYNSFSRINVASVTGAVAPNENIYFGGDIGEYGGETFTMKNAWFTTDFHIKETGNYKEARYYLKSREMKVVTDNKAVFYDTTLYIHNHKVGWFPWYAANIRKGSKVPLFPVWGNDSEYGFYFSQGVNYGNTKSKYLKGGFAPKFSDKLGLLVGRYENWHNLGKYGKGEITVDDFLVAKKDSAIEDRWDLNIKHKLTTENGYLNLHYQNTTVNKIGVLKGYRDDLEQGGYYDPKSPNYSGETRNDGEKISFYSANSQFENLGERKDTSYYAKVKMVGSKKQEKAYDQIVEKRLKDASFQTQVDDKLFIDTGFKVDNEDYTFSGYYDYLKDLDPGSTNNPEDDQSRRENYGAALNLKEYKIDLAYDHKSGDKLRFLRSWERTPDLKSIVKSQGKEINYVPFAVRKYDKDNSDIFKLHLGEYYIGDTLATYKVKFDSISTEQELNLDDDPFRWIAGPQNTKNKNSNPDFNKRDQGYNKYENIIYSKYREDKTGVEFQYENYRLELKVGRTEDTIRTREGIYNYTPAGEKSSYDEYRNDANFVEGEVEDKELSLGLLGDLDLTYNIRYNDYNNGYDTYNGKNNGGDSSLRQQGNFNHKLTLFDNTNDQFRYIDLSLKNEFNYFTQYYSYDDGSRSGSKNFNGYARLQGKESIDQFTDKVSMDLGNTTSVYTFGLKKTYDPLERKIKRGELVTNNYDFFIQDEKKLNLYLDLDKRYTRGRRTLKGYEFKEDKNDLTNLKYGGSYFYSDTVKLYYDHDEFNYELRKSSPLGTNAYAEGKESAKEDKYGLEVKDYLDVYNVTYTHGTDRRRDGGKDTFDVKNDIFRLSYLNGGDDVEHFYSASYGVYKYGATKELRDFSVDQISASYEYRDKSFTSEELRSYAAAEFNKSSLEVSAEEISRVRAILNKRNDNQLDFNLVSIMEEEMNKPEYKKFFKISSMVMIHREAYRKTHDVYKSAKEVEGNLYGSYKRYGLGYKYDETATINMNNNYDRNLTKRIHEVRFRAGIGKPSEGWNIKGSYKTTKEYGATTHHDDEYGIYLGKEMGYYEWAIGFTKNYSRETKNYDSRVALQFKLLTFPNNPLFGFGYKDKNKHISPRVWGGEAISVKDPDSL